MTDLHTQRLIVFPLQRQKGDSRSTNFKNSSKHAKERLTSSVSIITECGSGNFVAFNTQPNCLTYQLDAAFQIPSVFLGSHFIYIFFQARYLQLASDWRNNRNSTPRQRLTKVTSSKASTSIFHSPPTANFCSWTSWPLDPPALQCSVGWDRSVAPCLVNFSSDLFNRSPPVEYICLSVDLYSWNIYSLYLTLSYLFLSFFLFFSFIRFFFWGGRLSFTFFLWTR